MTPVCPRCGTIKTEKIAHQKTPRQRCLEKDCGHEGARSTFKQTSGYRNENRKWRDPVALSMDGYDE